MLFLYTKIIQLDSYLFSFNVYQCCLVYVHKSLDEKMVQEDPYVYICVMFICKKKKRSIPDFVCRNLLVVNDEMCVCKLRYFL